MLPWQLTEISFSSNIYILFYFSFISNNTFFLIGLILIAKNNSGARLIIAALITIEKLRNNRNKK